MLPLVELVQRLLPILELVVVRTLLPGILVELVQPMLLPTLSPALRCPLRLTDQPGNPFQKTRTFHN
jgi:hypothetical protein